MVKLGKGELQRRILLASLWQFSNSAGVLNRLEPHTLHVRPTVLSKCVHVRLVRNRDTGHILLNKVAHACVGGQQSVQTAI